VQGKPFSVSEVVHRIKELLADIDWHDECNMVSLLFIHKR